MPLVPELDRREQGEDGYNVQLNEQRHNEARPALVGDAAERQDPHQDRVGWHDHVGEPVPKLVGEHRRLAGSATSSPPVAP